jgi:hypothetical protein
MREHRIRIENGVAMFVYSDELAALAAQGTVSRASHVEPATDYGMAEGWVADMRPSGGGLLVQGTDGYQCREVFPGFRPAEERGFPTRQAALDAERQWLRRERGL